MFSEIDLLASYPFTSHQPVLVDVGAHHGTVSRLFAKKDWQIIAFEPEKKNREAFERNLAKFPQVTCLAKAVSDVTGQKVPFYVSQEHYGIHSLQPWHSTHQLAYEVETVRLDDILTEMQVTTVTLLKIDTEGADFLAIKGFDFHKYHPELVMIEFMDERTLTNFQYTYHDMVAYMKKYEYVTFVSAWESIQEYAREGVASNSHLWLQCAPYPLKTEPVWGNLIFVPERDQDKFSRTLNTYLNKLKKAQIKHWLRKQIEKIFLVKV